jgi:TIR domain
MIRIFISYRRSDSKSFAHRLYDGLRPVFGRRSVFMDVSEIEPGEDFPKVIDERLKSCRVLVAVIGATWDSCTDQDGRRRLDKADDYVRLEIAKALSRGILVIPLLVNGAAMPAESGLPDELKTLATRNALQIDDDRFDTDLEKLIEAIKPVVPPRSRWPRIAGTALAIALLAVGGYLAWEALTPGRGVRLIPSPRLWSNLPQQAGSGGMRYELVVQIDDTTARVPDLTRTIVYTGAKTADLKKLRTQPNLEALSRELNDQFGQFEKHAEIVAELVQSALMLPVPEGTPGASLRVEVACYDSAQGTMRRRAVWFTAEIKLESRGQSLFLKPSTRQCELAGS